MTEQDDLFGAEVVEQLFEVKVEGPDGELVRIIRNSVSAKVQRDKLLDRAAADA